MEGESSSPQVLGSGGGLGLRAAKSKEILGARFGLCKLWIFVEKAMHSEFVEFLC